MVVLGHQTSEKYYTKRSQAFFKMLQRTRIMFLDGNIVPASTGIVNLDYNTHRNFVLFNIAINTYLTPLSLWNS